MEKKFWLEVRHCGRKSQAYTIHHYMWGDMDVDEAFKKFDSLCESLGGTYHQGLSESPNRQIFNVGKWADQVSFWLRFEGDIYCGIPSRNLPNPFVNGSE
jgi:hypothetical protein